MDNIIQLIIGLLGGLGLGILFYFLSGQQKKPTSNVPPMPDFKKQADDINKKATASEQQVEKELNNASDQEIIDKFHSAFSKPVPHSDGSQTAADTSPDKPTGPEHP